MLGVLLALGALAFLVSSGAEEISVTVAEANDGTFHFVATQGGKVIFEDGPFASVEAAQAAADTWLAAKRSKPVALGCAGSGTPCRGGVSLGGSTISQQIVRSRAALGGIAHGVAGTIAPYNLVQTGSGIAIDIRDLHGMYLWAKDVAKDIGIRDHTMAGVALRRLAYHLVGRAPIAGINFGALGDDEWIDVLKYVRANIRPFTWKHLLEVVHARLHQLGYTSIEEAGIVGKPGVWRRRSRAPGGFVAKPGVPVHALDLGSCGEYEGDGGHWFICCKDDEGRYSCVQIRHGDPWLPVKRGGHAFKLGGRIG